jgi:quercetin dioxygenase-like cupin family protein
MILAVSAFAAITCVTLSPAWAQSNGHKLVKSADLKWSDVPSLPKGAQATVIEGPMNEAVPFTVRIKFPANHRLPPHWHPAVERVTVLSGEFHTGMGEKFDDKKVMGLKQGDMMIMQPKTPHHALTKAATVVQVHGTGPWAVNYVNADGDPRKKK